MQKFKFLHTYYILTMEMHAQYVAEANTLGCQMR